MKTLRPHPVFTFHPHALRAGFVVAVAVGGLLLGPDPVRGGTNYYDLREAEPGGLIPRPEIISISQTGLIQWHGFGGPYQLETKSSLGSTNWQPVGSPTHATSMAVPPADHASFFRVAGTPPAYSGFPNKVGDPSCAYCHFAPSSEFSETAHARAFELVRRGNLRFCYTCHTVGYGLATGFQNTNQTPHLEGVQCESCHGPADSHANNPRAIQPVVTLQSKLCGGCHNAHYPTYDGWQESKHSRIDEHVAESFHTGGTARMLQCGPCHSGSVRLTLLHNLTAPPARQKPLPTGDLAASIAIECVVCHDPHLESPYGSQLRNPKASLVPFSYNTSANTSFAAQYNAKVNICGQCHNARGAVWNDSGSRPPHHSPQYNLLTGTIGENNGVVTNSAHTYFTNQCAACHTHAPDPERPPYVGHSFEAQMHVCSKCHSASPATLWNGTQAEVRARIAEVKALLDQWALTAAPAILAGYGALSWEYNNVGQISNPTGAAGIRGPRTGAEQGSIPAAIKQARFNLYLVEHDGSYGVHNKPYALHLLQVAEERVRSLLPAQ